MRGIHFGKSDRTIRNVIVQCDAFNLFLGHEHDGNPVAKPGFEWLLSENKVRVSVLVELGRMLNEGWAQDTVISVARKLCAERPTVKAAVGRLRRARFVALGKPAPRPTDDDQLINEIVGAINGYLRRYPTPWSRVLDALEDTISIIERHSEAASKKVDVPADTGAAP